jgi:hypothetical protein
MGLAPRARSTLRNQIPDEAVIAISAIERASYPHQSAVRATPDHSDLRAPPGKRSKSHGDADRRHCAPRFRRSLITQRDTEQFACGFRSPTRAAMLRSPSVIGMLARRVPYRLGAVDNGSAWMGDVVQDRPVMVRFPRGLRPEAEKQLSGGAIRRAIGRRAMMPSARGSATHFGRGVRVGCRVLLPVESPPHAGLAQPAHQRAAAHHAGSPARTAAPAAPA